MEMRYLNVEGHPHLVRDVLTNAIINTDDQSHKAYLSLKNAKKREHSMIYNIENDVDQLKSDLNELKSDLNEIKNLLGKIVNGSH
jgi:hypothetical protein